MRKSFDTEKFAIQMQLSVTVFESNIERQRGQGVDEGGVIRIIYVGKTVL